MVDLTRLFVYDPSPVPATMVAGWNGAPNPFCFNCTHTIAFHTNLSESFDKAKAQGAEGTCEKEDCDCNSFYPGHFTPPNDLEQ